MKLTQVVAQHGFVPSDLGQINNAKLYQRQNEDGVLELLCVQKIGNVMRVDRKPMVAFGFGDTPILMPIGEGINNQLVPVEELENYLTVTLKP